MHTLTNWKNHTVCYDPSTLSFEHESELTVNDNINNTCNVGEPRRTKVHVYATRTQILHMHSLLQVNSGWQGEGGLKIKSAVKTKQKYVTSVNRSFIICQYLHVICSENSTFYRNCSWSSIEVATMHGKVLAQTDNCNSKLFQMYIFTVYYG